jgi:hypothetical protein
VIRGQADSNDRKAFFACFSWTLRFNSTQVEAGPQIGASCHHGPFSGELELSGMRKTGQLKLSTFPKTGKLTLHIQPKTSQL